MLGAAGRGVQGEGTGVGEAVKNPFALCEARNGKPVVFLIEKKAGLLSVLDIDMVGNLVFGDDKIG